MPCENKTKRSNIRGPMNLFVDQESYWLHNEVPIALMNSDEMAKADNVRLYCSDLPVR